MPFSWTKDTTKLDNLQQTASLDIDRFGAAIAAEITSDIMVSFGTSPPGITYKRGSVEHTASIAGFPPNADIGTLRASMHWEQQGKGRFIVSDGVEYGIYLELGTEHIQPRPFVAPVFAEWQAHKLEDWARQLGIFKDVDKG